jgi:hypothetical protein
VSIRSRHRRRELFYAQSWRGAYRGYDLVKEFVAALSVVGLLVLVLAAVFGSPDRPAITLTEWATQAPDDFLTTAVAELDGTSTSATYGAPYINDPTAGQMVGPLPLQRWGGVREPVDPAMDFVVRPLSTSTNPDILAALKKYEGASSDQQTGWASAYGDALANAPDGDPGKVAPGDYGPVPAMVTGLLAMATSGALDGLIQEQGGFYQTNYARSSLFLADGGYLNDQARAEHLGGNQWGMMNEVGGFPGQPWLAPYSFWYQIPPFTSSHNADALIWALMSSVAILFTLIPFIPGLRELPRRLRAYRLIWRDHYRNNPGSPTTGSGPRHGGAGVTFRRSRPEPAGSRDHA